MLNARDAREMDPRTIEFNNRKWAIIEHLERAIQDGAAKGIRSVRSQPFTKEDGGRRFLWWTYVDKWSLYGRIAERFTLFDFTVDVERVNDGPDKRYQLVISW